MTQRQLYHVMPTPAWITALETENLEHTVQPAGGSAAQSILFKCLRWFTPLSGSSAALCVFQSAWDALSLFQAIHLL